MDKRLKLGRGGFPILLNSLGVISMTLFIALSPQSRIVGAAEFFPTDSRFMMEILRSKQREWTRDGFFYELELQKSEKLLVKLWVPAFVYDFDPKWRVQALAYMKFLYPRIVKQIRKYASDEFLSVFDPKLDIEWEIYLKNSLYGTFRQGKLKWKRGIY